MLFLIFRKMEPLLFDESLLPLGSVDTVLPLIEQGQILGQMADPI